MDGSYARKNVEGGSQGRLPPSTAGFGYLFNLVKIKSASLWEALKSKQS
jgi:hypothetical protein